MSAVKYNSHSAVISMSKSNHHIDMERIADKTT